MSNILGTIWHGVCIANPKVSIFSAVTFVYVIALTIANKKIPKDEYGHAIWRTLCTLPFVASVIHFFFMYAGAAPDEMAAILYLPSLFIVLWGAFGKKKIPYIAATAVVNTIAAVSCILCLMFGASAYVGNFTRMNYTNSFKAAIAEMKAHYVLTEWKETDFDALEAELLPKVEEAEKNQDAGAFAAAVGELRYKLNDGHINMRIINDNLREDFEEQYAGNDYGFSMMTLDDGRTIAVMTDDACDAYAAGIHDGTEITKWDGVPVETAKETVEYTAVKSIPVASNEKFMKAAFLAGSGGETVSVTFKNDSGKEETVSLKKIGSYYPRYQAMTSRLFSKDATSGENFSCRMITDDCGYMLVNKEHFNSYDLVAYTMGEHPYVKKKVLENLDWMKERGMKKLIIDLRNNGGGFDDVSLGWLSVFADKEYYGFSLAGAPSGGYKSVSDHVIKQGGEYADLEVAVLVNMNCISAGDGTALYLSRLPNVTLLGMTDPNGSNQETGGICYLSGGIISISYPVGMVLDENGNPNVDTAADRISRNPADVRIPLDYDAAMRIFDGDGNYELDYAINYLNGK